MTKPTRTNLDALRVDLDMVVPRLERGKIDGDDLNTLVRCLKQLKEVVFPISDLVVDLNTNDCKRAGMSKRLTRSQTPLLFTLNKHYPETVTFEVLSKALYGAQPPETDSALKFMICTLRQRVAPLGIDIRNVGGVGYHLVLTAEPTKEQEEAVA